MTKLSKYKIILFTLPIIFFSGRLLAVDHYLCIAEHSAGIAFDKSTKRWHGVIFKADQKILISKANDDERKRGATWTVKSVGSDQPEAFCAKDFNDGGYLFCNGFSDFKLNRKNLRYISIYAVGYVTYVQGEDSSVFRSEGADTPAISVGKCSPI